MWKVLEASFRHHNFYSQGEHWLESLMHSSDSSECDVARQCLELCAVVYHMPLHLVSLDCEDDVMLLMDFEALDDTQTVREMLCESLGCMRIRHEFQEFRSWFRQMDMSFDSCCFLLTCFYSVKISSYISKHMRRMERRFPLLSVLNLFLIWFVMLLHKVVLQPPASQGEFLPSKPGCELLKSLYVATHLRKFALELLEVFGLFDCKHVCPPMELHLQLSQDTGGLLPDVSHYRQSIGKVISLTATRSFIGFAVNQLSHYMFASHFAHLLVVSSVLHYFKTDPRFVSASWKSKQEDVICKNLDEAEYISMANTACELDWLSDLLHALHFQLVDSIVLFYANQEALHIVNSLVYHVLLQQSFPTIFLQGQSQDYGFIKHMIVAYSGWFGSILELLYCSLPRPPEDFSDFG